MKTRVIITRTTYPVQATFVTSISPNPTDEQIQGSFEQQTISTTYTDNSLTSTTQTSGKAGGTITITNDWTQNQPLQATTRFLTPEGIQFRSTERVDVPAGGTVDVHVIADEEGGQGDIAEGTNFTIPGLWQGLQNKIYGTNKKAFTGGLRTISVVSQADIDKAKSEALKQLDEEAKTSFTAPDQNIEQYVLRSELLLSQANVAAGDTANELTYSVRGRYLAVDIPSEELYSLLYEKLGLVLTESEEITQIDLSSLDITIEHASTDTGIAQLRIHAEAQAQLKNSSSLFSAVSLANKTPEQLQDIADKEQGITSIKAELSPFWIKKTPFNENHLTIIIN